MSADDGIMSPPAKRPLPIESPQQGSTPKKQKTKQERDDEKVRKEAEKEEKRLAKEQKQREKELIQKAKDEEKQREKELMQKAREEKQREKDLKQKAKDDEKRRRQEEIDKKERAQSRLGSFFTPKPISKTAPAAASPVKSSVSKPIQTEYEATFLPFCLPSHTTFPKNYMERIDPEKTIDFYGSEAKPAALSDFPRPPPRTSPNMSVRQIMELLQGPASSAIGPAGEINLAHLRAMEMLQQVEMKYLHFHENVRPPYHGTWTKPLSRLQWRSLAVNPESKVDIFDYDYDSEAEWEEPEDGEDIRSQGEEDEDEADGGDDLEGFVVEDGVSGSPSPKRSLFANDMVPVCTGLRWEDPKGAQHPSDISGARIDFDELRMGFLLTPEPGTVDPLSVEYWAPSTSSVQESLSPAKKILQRQALTDKTAQVNVPHPPGKQLKAARHVPAEDLEEFKASVVGQDLTKVAMVEHLKKQFPKLHKDAIANTLGAIAERESKKPSAKWRLKA